MFLNKKILLLASIIFLLVSPVNVLAHQPRLIYNQGGDIDIENPEISQAFYDELKGEPRNYFIESGLDFNLYINLLVPLAENRNGRYSANAFFINQDNEEQIVAIDGLSYEW